ncbi:MAG: ABC transporter permease [Roseovarius sp.]
MAEADPAITGPWRGICRQFRRHKGAMLGAWLFTAIALAVLVGPVIWGVAPDALDFSARNAGPSATHPFGTDQLGRDLLAQVLVGGRVSLAVGLAAMLVTVVLGTLVGLLAGVFPRLDGLLMRLTDLFLSLPLLPLLLVIMMLFRETLSAAVGTETGIFLLIVGAIGLTSWMPVARIVRADVLSVREREFMLAARAAGTTRLRQVTRHILPNILSPIVVSATLAIANAIITESALSFLGLGFPSDFPTWGRLLSDGVVYLSEFPWRVFWPGLMISLTVLSVNFMGDGLRDAFDPRLRARAAQR